MSRRRDFSDTGARDRQESGERDTQYVVALERAFIILRSFQAHDSDLSNTELAERTGFSKPLVSRMTNTLTRLGYLAYAERTGTYSLAAGLIALSAPLLTGLSIRERARPLMRELADRCGSSLILSAPSATTMTYVEHIPGSASVILQFALGSQVPMERSAVGRAYLASLDDDARARQIARLREAGVLDDTIEKGIDNVIADVHRQGFCVSLSGWREHINAVATPLLFPGSTMPLVLSCGGPVFALEEDAMRKEIGPELVRIARKLGAEPTRRQRPFAAHARHRTRQGRLP